MTKYLICLSKEGAKALKRTSRLPEQERLISAIVAPKGVEERLRRWDKDSLRDILSQMGRKNLGAVAFVEVSEGVEKFGPFSRNRGLIEYKLPTGIQVTGYDLLKL